jgi:hypothetical protein
MAEVVNAGLPSEVVTLREDLNFEQAEPLMAASVEPRQVAAAVVVGDFLRDEGIRGNEDTNTEGAKEDYNKKSAQMMETASAAAEEEDDDELKAVMMVNLELKVKPEGREQQMQVRAHVSRRLERELEERQQLLEQSERMNEQASKTATVAVAEVSLSFGFCPL